MFLLKYTSKGSSGYVLVYAANFDTAKELFLEKYWYLDSPHIENCTLS